MRGRQRTRETDIDHVLLRYREKCSGNRTRRGLGSKPVRAAFFLFFFFFSQKSGAAAAVPAASPPTALDYCVAKLSCAD